MKRLESDKRVSFLKKSGAAAIVGLLVAACGGPDAQSKTETPTPISPIRTPTSETIFPSPATTVVTPTESPTATPTLAPSETPKTHEEIAAEFESYLWHAKEDAPLAFSAQPIKKDEAGEWQTDESKPVETLYFSGINFRIADVTATTNPDGSTTFSGFVSGVTGDHRIYTVTLAIKSPDGTWEYAAEPVEIYQGEESKTVSTYLYMVRESSFYLYKGLNTAQTIQLLTESMMETPIAANGGEFNFLDRIDAKHTFDSALYKPGYAILGGQLVLVQAGGACGVATPTARALAQVESGEIIEGDPHSHPTYENLPLGGVEDLVDVTVYYSPKPWQNQNLVWVNHSSENLWLVYHISYYPYGDFPDNWSVYANPSPVAMAIEVSVMRRPPTQQELDAIAGSKAKLQTYIDTREWNN